MTCFLAVLIILVVALAGIGFLAYLGKCPDCYHPDRCFCLFACEEMDERCRGIDDDAE